MATELTVCGWLMQADESSVESAWCPPLPELISSKADNSCPCPADYAEVSPAPNARTASCPAAVGVRFASAEKQPEKQPEPRPGWLTCFLFEAHLLTRVHAAPLTQTRPQLIRRCRAPNPTHRPTFDHIRKFVQRINPVKVSPVDMMMSLVRTRPSTPPARRQLSEHFL